MDCSITIVPAQMRCGSAKGHLQHGWHCVTRRALSQREEETAQAMTASIQWTPQLDLRLSPSEREQVWKTLQTAFLKDVADWCLQV